MYTFPFRAKCTYFLFSIVPKKRYAVNGGRGDERLLCDPLRHLLDENVIGKDAENAAGRRYRPAQGARLIRPHTTKKRPPIPGGHFLVAAIRFERMTGRV